MAGAAACGLRYVWRIVCSKWLRAASAPDFGLVSLYYVMAPKCFNSLIGASLAALGESKRSVIVVRLGLRSAEARHLYPSLVIMLRLLRTSAIFSVVRL